MGDSTIEYIHYEAAAPLKLPRYLQKTKFGIDRQAGADTPASKPIKLPQRAQGTVEVPNWPKFSKIWGAIDPTEVQNAFEDLPSKLVACPNKVSKKFLWKPDSDTHVSIGKTSTQIWCFVTNRHIPQDTSVYYVEMEGDALETACIGLIKMRVDYTAPSWNGNIGHCPSQDGMDEEPEAEDIPMRSTSSLRATEDDSSGSEYAETSFMAVLSDEANHSNAEEGSASDDDESFEETDYEEDGDEEEVDHNGDDSNVAESEDESRSESIPVLLESNSSRHAPMAGYPRQTDVQANSARYTGSRCVVRFPGLKATYNSRFRKSNRPDISISRCRSKECPPFCSWNLKTGALQLGDVMLPSAQRAELIPDQSGYRNKQRAGMLIDFLHRKIKFTLNGALIDQDLDMPEGEPYRGKSNKQYFPFFGIQEGAFDVIFGDGNAESDGFAFDVLGYTSSLHTSLPQIENLAVSTEELVHEYLKFYGYTVTLGLNSPEKLTFRGQIRRFIEERAISNLVTLLQNTNISQETRFFLDLAAFVEAARRYSDEFLTQDEANLPQEIIAASDLQLAKTLEMGRNLLKLAGNDVEKQKLVQESSAILITEEPRATNIARHYDDLAKKRLLIRIYADIDPDIKLPKLEIFAAKAEALSEKAPVGNRSAAHAVATLHGLCEFLH